MFDLNIRSKSKEKDRQLLVKRLLELGWSTVAWNINVNGKANANLHKPPSTVTIDQMQRKDICRFRSLVSKEPSCMDDNLRQLTRITLTIDDLFDANSLNTGNEALRAFDIVAANPGNAKIFAYLCQSAEIDIISLDFTHRLAFGINKKLLDEAVKRGIFFEILYSPMLSSSGSRREVISGCKLIIQYLRGRNIILSSGADSFNSIRGPCDVENIGGILSLSNELSTKSITENCALVMKHAFARKLKYIPIQILDHKTLIEKWPEVEMKASQSQKKWKEYLASGNIECEKDNIANEDVNMSSTTDVIAIATGSIINNKKRTREEEEDIAVAGIVAVDDVIDTTREIIAEDSTLKQPNLKKKKKSRKKKVESSLIVEEENNNEGEEEDLVIYNSIEEGNKESSDNENDGFISLSF